MTNPALLMIKGLISEFPEEDRKKVEECAAKLRAAIEEYGDQGLVALALVGIENQEEEVTL